MHLVLLSGGSGKRLWPLSNEVRSKQFLSLLECADGTQESMVQRVFRQITLNNTWDSVSIVAGAPQREQILSQLGTDINLIIEPCRRDTFPAIALACAYLFSEKNVKSNECIAICPVDPYVEQEYFDKIREIEGVLEGADTEIVLIGARPIKPSEKYGYIIPKANKECGISDVLEFREKPDLKKAQELINKGALWNCGVFGIKMDTVINVLESEYGIKDFSFNNIKEEFENLKKTSFDYEVVEKAKNIKVIRYDGEWKDLGTWETLTEELKTDIVGNVITDGLCKNTFVMNENELPVVAMGLKDIVVVSSYDGILVANKGETYKLKEVLSDLKNRPMYEDRRWGNYTVIEYEKINEQNLDDKQGYLTKKLRIFKGKQISYQYHDYRKEIWTIVSGEGIAYIDDDKRNVKCGDVIIIDSKVRHAIKAISDLEIIEIQIGQQLVEEDIVRLNLEW